MAKHKKKSLQKHLRKKKKQREEPRKPKNERDKAVLLDKTSN